MRLRTVIAWLRLDAEGHPKPPDTTLFSNEVGDPLQVYHRQWSTIVLKAHGLTPAWSAALKYKGLTDASQEAFRRINLRWHDLRHEYASRLVEHGVPLAQVRDLLGHASITTTERYDNQTLANLQVAAARLERGLGFASAGHSTGGIRAEVDRSAGEITDRRTSPTATPGTTPGTRPPKPALDDGQRWWKFLDSFKIEATDELDRAPEIASRQGFERG
ncbi:MAG: site-specific integrase, partial [Acidobacteria bacterium]|nr:site-specific integrase [Acidobacteriota bacterium]